MLITVGIRTRPDSASAAEIELSEVFSGYSDVELVTTFANGRYADFEMAEDTYRALSRDFIGTLTFTKKLDFDPY